MPFIKIERLTNAVKVIGEELEDYIADEIQDAINIFRDDELGEAKQDAYDDTTEVDYRVDNADAEIDDLKNQLSNLQDEIESLNDETARYEDTINDIKGMLPNLKGE